MAQVVDDDSNVVVQLALLLGVREMGRLSAAASVPAQTHLLHHSTIGSQTSNFESFFRKQLEPTLGQDMGMDGDRANVG